ncbi:hypothetical protein M3Y94_00128900 [Aphelenchoides besseyi]|nr:hypothetical protein M3Y94_00128900 [Aphelenchoides besseyi]
MNQQSYGNYGQNMEQQQGNYMNQSQQMMYPQGMMNSNHMNNQINNQMMGSNHMGNPINNQMMNSNHMNNQMNNQMGNQMGKHQNQSQQFHPQHYMNSSSQEQPMYSQQQNMSHGNQINNQINNQMGQVNSQMNNQMGIHQNQSQQFHPPSYSTSQEQMMYSQQNMMGHNQMSGMQNQMNNQMINRGNQQPVMMNQMPPASYQNNSGMNMNTVNQQSQSHPQSQQIVPPNRNQGMSQQFMQQPHSQLPNQQSQMQNQPPQMPQHQMRQQPQGNMMPQPPSSHHNMPQPSPQAYQTNSVPPFNQPPGSVGSMHAHTPLQQQLGVPQRNPDGRFASPASVTQKSPATAVFSNQPMSNTQVNRPVVPVARQASPVPQALHFPPLPTDPILANRDLTVGPLRRALADICQKSRISSFAEVLYRYSWTATNRANRTTIFGYAICSNKLIYWTLR